MKRSLSQPAFGKNAHPEVGAIDGPMPQLSSALAPFKPAPVENAAEMLTLFLLGEVCRLYARGVGDISQVDDDDYDERLFRFVASELQDRGIIVSGSSFEDVHVFKATYAAQFRNMLKAAVQQIEASAPGDIVRRPRGIEEQPNRKLISLLGGMVLRKSRFESEFKAVKLLGRGGYGKVWLAINHLDGIGYAVKQIKLKRLLFTSEWHDRIMREVQTLAGIDHPNIVRYNTAWVEVTPIEAAPPAKEEDMSESTGVSSDNDTTGEGYLQHPVPETRALVPLRKAGDAPAPVQVSLFIQMQLCQQDLKQWIEQRQHISKTETLDIAFQMTKAVQHLHACDILHRDIKPSNLFINAVGEKIIVKLGDLGLAKHIGFPLSSEPPTPSLYSPDIELTGGLGTPTYGSPEQLSGGRYSKSSDMFSVGIVLFELFSQFETGMERAVAIRKLRSGEGCGSLRARFPHVAEIVEQLCALDPEKRPTAAQLADMDIFAPFHASADVLIRLKEELAQKDAEIQRLHQIVLEAQQVRDVDE